MKHFNKITALFCACIDRESGRPILHEIIYIGF